MYFDRGVKGAETDELSAIFCRTMRLVGTTTSLLRPKPWDMEAEPKAKEDKRRVDLGKPPEVGAGSEA